MPNGEIVITLKKGTSSENQTAISKSLKRATTDDIDELETSTLSGMQKSILLNDEAIALFSVAIAGSVLSSADYFIDRALMLRDDYQGQRSLNVAKNLIGKGISTATFVGVGVAIGGVVGGVIGAVVSVANTNMEIYKNYSQERLKITSMNESLKFNEERAGTSLIDGNRGTYLWEI